MRKLISIRLLIAALLVSASTLFAQGNYKVEPAGAPPADVPKAVADLLSKTGAKLVSDQGPVAEIWLRQDIPAAASPDSSSDVLYGAIAPGTLVGVLHFPAAATDFRGQPIKAGYYTLRYDLVPQDGNHMGVSQYRDFLLLVPTAQDTSPTATLAFNDLVKLSRASTGTGHPGVLVMDPVNQSAGQLPAAFKDDLGNWAVQLKGASGSKDLPLAVVLVGKYQE